MVFVSRISFKANIDHICRTKAQCQKRISEFKIDELELVKIILSQFPWSYLIKSKILKRSQKSEFLTFFKLKKSSDRLVKFSRFIIIYLWIFFRKVSDKTQVSMSKTWTPSPSFHSKSVLCQRNEPYRVF